MAVVIDSGPVTDRLGLGEVAPDRWFELMQVRRGFLAVHLPHDCRRLLEFVEDAEQMYAPLGFSSADDFIRRGLELDPQQVAWALEGLKRMKPDEPIPYQRAIEVGRIVAQHGGDRGNQHTGGKRQGDRQGDNITLARGTSRDYIVGRLDRDGHKALASAVRAKTMSARAAAIEAGYCNAPPTPLAKIFKLLSKLSEEDRRVVRVRLDELDGRGA